MPHQIKKFMVALYFLLIPNAVLAQTRVLSVLCPQGLIDSKIFADFERQTRINLRVELTIGHKEPEQRLKSSVNNWDVIITHESQLMNLSANRLIKAYKEEKDVDNRSSIFYKKTKIQEEFHAYAPLMVDPLGIAWIEGTKKQADISWQSLIDPAQNPTWRSRIFIPLEPALQFKIAMLATGQNNIFAPISELGPAFDWLKKVKQQVPQISSQLLIELLGKNVVAGVVWKSDYLKMRKIVPSLDFASPKPKSFFTRYGAGIVTDTLKEDLAINFMAYIIQRRDELAKFSGLLPLSFAENTKGFNDSNWELYDDSMPLPREIEAALKKSK